MGKMAETSLGGWAECTARQLLEAHDFQILSQNFHSRYGEIDLIAVRDHDVVFAEVKARAATQFGHAYDVITRAKQLKIIKTAWVFLAENPQLHSYFFRFDVFCFDFYRKFAKNVQYDFAKFPYDLQWIENAFTLDTDLIRL
mgnify:CR=1 FL=1|nr:YraN family protein [Acinetobacter pullicarnis]